MPGFTKLYNTIVTSSVWSEDDKTRILWITLLASADAKGFVDGTIPGMAALARISVDDAAKGIRKLESPDAYSRTADNDGRRIKPVEGGWLILNYARYRERRDPEKRREQNREAQRRYRERHRKPKRKPRKPNISPRQKTEDIYTPLTPQGGNGGADPPKTTERTKRPRTPKASNNGELDERFDRVWKVYPRKKNKQAARKAFAKLKPDDAFTDRLIASIHQHMQTKDWRKDGGQFIPYLASFLNAGGYDDEITDADLVCCSETAPAPVERLPGGKTARDLALEGTRV